MQLMQLLPERLLASELRLELGPKALHVDTPGLLQELMDPV